MEKPKILYVDDEKDNLFIFSVAFRHHYHVLTALSGEEALARFADNPDVAVVVADQRMPGMTGVELLSRIRERDPEVVRVILTAYTDVPDIIEAINRGQIYHYAVKPWVEQDLLHLLGKAVETHRLLRENRRLLTELAEKNRLLEEDIGKRKRMETILLRRDMILAAVTGMASSLLLHADWQANIEGLIGRMALVLGVSRVHILRYATGADGAVVLIPEFRWISSDGLPPEGASRLAPIVHRSDAFVSFRKILARGEMVRGNAGDFADAEMRELLRLYHIRSIALAPIMVNNACWGVISFADCLREREWPEAELDALKTAAILIGNAIARERAEESLATQQAQLAHAGRLNALGEMASGIGHEIHQPLTVISLGAETCKGYFDRHDPTCPAAEAAEEIRQHVKKITTIINSMRSFSRSTSGEWRKVALNWPLCEALTFFREQFRMHGILFEERISADLPLVKTDGQKFEQIAVNFLSNARYAVDKLGPAAEKRIIVSLGFTELSEEAFAAKGLAGKPGLARQVIVFEVKDNGIGMDAETKNRCLEPFFTTKEPGEGTGLGLSVTHSLAQELGYRLEIDSSEGLGAAFRLIIPVAEEDCI